MRLYVGLAVLFFASPARLLLAAPDDEHHRDADRAPRLTVTGNAKVRARPDQATIRLGAMSQATEAQTAQTNVSAVVSEAIAAIRELGIPADSISTVDISIHPVFDHRRRPRDDGEDDQGPRIVGYRASNTIQVIVRDLAKVGAVIDAGVKSGANQIQQLSFGLSNDTEHRLEALRNSVAEARSKARAMADALGYDLKGVHSIREGGYHLAEPRIQAMDARALAMEAATPVEPGQVEIHASVTIEYIIAPPGDEPRGDSRDRGRRERLRDPAPEERSERGARDPSPEERAERGARDPSPEERAERGARDPAPRERSDRRNP